MTLHSVIVQMYLLTYVMCEGRKDKSLGSAENGDFCPIAAKERQKAIYLKLCSIDPRPQWGIGP
jgi:hypothetical protein